VDPINVDNFPDIDHGHMCISLEKKVEDRLPSFPQTYSRAEGAMRFCWFVSGDEKTLFDSDLDKRNRLRESFLRASLAEFVSMEETLVRDLNNAGNTISAIKINDSSNPLLHILRELRNLEIHLTSSTLSAEQKVFLWKPEGGETKFTSSVWFIDNLEPSNFLQLRNARNYDATQLQAVANLFLVAQKEWGINELILRGINTYSGEIIDRYEL